MRLNESQLKHIAKTFDVIALAALAPVLAEITGIREFSDLTIVKIVLFVAFAAILEVSALLVLGGIKENDT